MANSPTPHTKRRQLSDASCGSSSYGDAKRLRSLVAQDDDASPLHEYGAAFDEAMAYREHSIISQEDVGFSHMSDTESHCEEVRGFKFVC
jgi:hypothetical protein